jgi:putative addiction module killer protein
MVELVHSDAFDEWLDHLRDERAKGRIVQRLVRLAAGNPGDVKPVGEGVSELRIDYGPGYRVYYMQRGEEIIVLLCGGDKSTQGRDIRKAKEIAEDWRDTHDQA